MITVVDLSHAPRESLPFAPETLAAMERALAGGRHVVVHYNRRGAGNALVCRTCGEVSRCPRCDVSLVRHIRPADRLKCHHCGYSCPPPDICPVCGGAELATVGSGTQSIETALREIFPQTRLLRLDADSDDEAASVDDEIPTIFVGTTSVLSVYSDRIGACVFALFESDSFAARYDTDEVLHRRIRLLSERAEETVVQTYVPAHPVIRTFVEGTYRDFARNTLARRMEFGYPPYAELVHIVARHRDRERLDAIMAGLETGLQGRQATTELYSDRTTAEREDGLYRRKIVLK
jgi:primosomal protein N' (replication factor Y) (superfamily II helicase)